MSILYKEHCFEKKPLKELRVGVTIEKIYMKIQVFLVKLHNAF